MICIRFSGIREDQKDILMALLIAEGYEGFEETDQSLFAYIEEEQFSSAAIQDLIASQELLSGIISQEEILPPRNWNEEWEKNFKPVRIGDHILIRASFHEPGKEIKHEIIIDPKMSFGTGHHETTAMMMKLMLEENFNGENVLDFGSGTGILSILAYQLGASTILAIDHEEWAVQNCRENFERNHMTGSTFEIQQGTHQNFKGKKFGIILANINKNVLLATMKDLAAAQPPNGKLFLSGILSQDENSIRSAANAEGYMALRSGREGDWMAMLFVKK